MWGGMELHIVWCLGQLLWQLMLIHTVIIMVVWQQQAAVCSALHDYVQHCPDADPEHTQFRSHQAGGIDITSFQLYVRQNEAIQKCKPLSLAENCVQFGR